MKSRFVKLNIMLLFFGLKLQVEIDILAAGIVQDHHGVIGGTFLLRPHSLDGGTALFQKIGRHFPSHFLMAAGPETVILPHDKLTGTVRTGEVLLALVDQIGRAHV